MGCMTVVGPRTHRLIVEAEQRFEADRQARPLPHVPHREQHPRHEELRFIESWRIVSVSPSVPSTTSWCATSPGSRTECTRIPSTSAPRAPGSSWVVASGGARARRPARVGEQGRGAHRGAGRRVDLAGVVQLDHLDRVEEPGGLPGELHGEHGADAEVGGDEDVPRACRRASRGRCRAGAASKPLVPTTAAMPWSRAKPDVVERGARVRDVDDHLGPGVGEGGERVTAVDLARPAPGPVRPSTARQISVPIRPRAPSTPTLIVSPTPAESLVRRRPRPGTSAPTHTAVASNPAASSIRMLQPTAASAVRVDGHARCPAERATPPGTPPARTRGPARPPAPRRTRRSRAARRRAASGRARPRRASGRREQVLEHRAERDERRPRRRAPSSRRRRRGARPTPRCPRRRAAARAAPGRRPPRARRATRSAGETVSTLPRADTPPSYGSRPGSRAPRSGVPQSGPQPARRACARHGRAGAGAAGLGVPAAPGDVPGDLTGVGRGDVRGEAAQEPAQHDALLPVQRREQPSSTCEQVGLHLSRSAGPGRRR